MWTYNNTYDSNELYHYGVKGMKWGVRRYQNPDGSLTNAGKKRRDRTINSINNMYGRINKRTTRLGDKFEAKGKTAKANVMRELVRQNEVNRKRNVNQIKNANAEQYNKLRKQSRSDVFWDNRGRFGSKNVNLTSKLSRLSEENTQLGMRWIARQTLNTTLSRVDPKQGVEFLERSERMYSHDN